MVSPAGGNAESKSMDFIVEGMTCGRCIARVHKAIAAIEGVVNASVDLESQIAHVDYDTNVLLSSETVTFLNETIIQAIQNIGYKVSFKKRNSINSYSEACFDLIVDGMSCGKCVGRVEKLITSIEGVLHTTVDLDSKIAHIVYKSNVIGVLEVAIGKINANGYTAVELIKTSPIEIELPEPTLFPFTSNDIERIRIQSIRSPFLNQLSENTRERLETQSDARRVMFSIEGMSCAACVGRIEKCLQATPGIHHATVTLATNSGVVEYSAGQLTHHSVLQVVDGIGYRTELIEDASLESDPQDTSHASIVVSAEITSSTSLSKGDFAIALDALQGVLTVHVHPNPVNTTTASIATRQKPRIWTFKIKFDEDVIGPRDIVLAAERMGVQLEVSSVGGFMRAGRMSQQHTRELNALRKDLILCTLCTLPILIIGMAIPNLGSESAKQSIFTPFESTPGMNFYGLLLFVFCTPVEFFVGLRFHLKAFEAIKSYTMGMDFLVSTGTGAAYLYSLIYFVKGIIEGMPHEGDVEYFETAAVLITVVILGKYLETYSRGKTASAIHELASHRAPSARLISPPFRRDPRNVFVIENNEEDSLHAVQPASSSNTHRGYTVLPMPSEPDSPLPAAFEEDEVIDISLVHKGDVLRLVAGETVPADGILISEKVDVDESMITGESMAVGKVVGSKVFGGTIVIEGAAMMRVEVCGDKATLGKILALVQEAQSTRPAIQEVADKVASYFVPTIAVISLITFISWIIAWETGNVPHEWMDDHNATSAAFAFYFALSVWVSACPCAFGLATPTAILVASGVAAKHGILIRKGSALQLSSEELTILYIQYNK